MFFCRILNSNLVTIVAEERSRTMWKAALLIGFFLAEGWSKECVPRSFGHNKIVCVCNSTYCDTTPDADPKVPPNGRFYWYVSTKDGERLSLKEKEFGDAHSNLFTLTLTVDSTVRYQKILGFGGAFTDSAGMHITSLSNATQDQLMRAYFDTKEGSGYMLGRVPIGSSDFSTRVYTYDDTQDDDTLEHFSLAQEDYQYKLPLMRKAHELNPEVKFFSAAWSPPRWMKTNDEINGFGFLDRKYYDVYSNYLVKFLDEYRKNGVNIWGISTGNEPINAFIPFDKLNSLGWTPPTVSEWVGEHFGPILEASDHNDTIIMGLDDQRIFLPWFAKNAYPRHNMSKYIAGTAVHYYADALAPAGLLDLTHEAFPDKFILMTEACTGTVPALRHVDLGSWDRGETYILSILEYLNHWSVGWVDWNLALDKSGGPNWINNFVDSPIIVNSTSDEFYKQPMYYALKHVSRFVVRGSVRVSMTDDVMVKSAAFVTPSNETVIVLYNKWSIPRNVVIKDTKKGPIHLELPAQSMNTIIYGQ
ncbi:lysosomal acid glucosylceramidase-like isoform X1 [Nomia melanderi]|uniref:lysosomal acid glucosylceramidase-like isoform X1 n=2 Tax=Nomia melanderi TaxID=2448451 RepID=UPI003FCE87BF